MANKGPSLLPVSHEPGDERTDRGTTAGGPFFESEDTDQAPRSSADVERLMSYETYEPAGMTIVPLSCGTGRERERERERVSARDEPLRTDPPSTITHTDVVHICQIAVEPDRTAAQQ